MDDDNIALAKRPDGGNVMTAGWVLLVLGLIGLFAAVTSDDLRNFSLLLAVAQIGLGLGALLVPLGYIVRALYFLPGRDVTEAELNGYELLKEGEARIDCEWCDQSVLAPNKPCSAVEPEQLMSIANDVSNNKCRLQLAEHGFLKESDD